MDLVPGPEDGMDDGGYGEGVEAVDEHGPRGLDVRLRIVAVRQTTHPNQQVCIRV